MYVVKKEDQRTGKLTKGIVSRHLTKSAYHPRGIKVMLRGLIVGRVARFADNDAIGGSTADTVDTSTAGSKGRNNSSFKKTISLPDYLREEKVDKKLSLLVKAAASASIRVAKDLRQLPLLDCNAELIEGGNINVQGEEQKAMDVRANEIFMQQLKPVAASIVSEEEESIVAGDAAQYAIAFDPLDGSSNLDVSAPTGSIFGIYNYQASDDGGQPFESPARQSLVAAGYTVYSSSTELVLAGLGSGGVVGFTLDDEDNTFRCSRRNMVCPERGPYYSLNEAREPDWPDGLRRWINDAKLGETPSGTRYSSRYVCSLAADVHRTIIKGGWAGNPRPHLRLLYEAAPLAFIMEAAGGAGSDGISNLLDIKPEGLHDRVCCFLGSKLDIKDLEKYGDVQQRSKTYEV